MSVVEYRRLLVLWVVTIVTVVTAWLTFEIRSGGLSWNISIARPLARAFYLAAAMLTVFTPIVTMRSVPAAVMRRSLFGAMGELSRFRAAIARVVTQAWPRVAQYAPQMVAATIAAVAVGVATVSLSTSIDDGVEMMRRVPSALAAIGLVWASGAVAVTPGTPRAERMARTCALLALALLAWTRGGQRPWPTLAPALVTTAVLMSAGAVAQRRLPRVAWPASVMSSIAIACAATVALTPVMLHWNVSGWMDSHSYDVAAINIATGKVLSARSLYMPLYQYGMGAIYWAVGHFFFAQQLINVLLALVAVAAVGYAARLLFHSLAAAAVASLAMAYSVDLYQYVHVTQIENWYIPIVCLILLAWARYWQDPNAATLLWMASALALGMNTRNQGAPLFGMVCLAPLAVSRLRLPARLLHVGMCTAVVALSLVPWAYRNYVVEGRFSPAASRSALYFGVLNDHRLGLYGIRYWDGWATVEGEFTRKYPDPAQRERASMHASWSALVKDPSWTVRAMVYRTLAFYGLLPSGLLNLTAMLPTDWATEWPSYLYWRLSPLVLLAISALAFATRYSAVQGLLALALLANLSIVLFAGSSEARIGHPSWPIHAVMAAGLFARSSERDRATPLVGSFLSRRAAAGTAVAILIGVVATRILIGAPNAYRPQLETNVHVQSDLRLSSDAADLDAATVGQTVRVRCMLSNYMYPPKIGGGPAPGMPAFAADPARETYYYAYLLSPDFGTVTGVIGVAFAGADVSEPLFESRVADLEGVLVADLPVPDEHVLLYARRWLRVTKARQLSIPAASLPAYP